MKGFKKKRERERDRERERERERDRRKEGGRWRGGKCERDR